MTDYATHRFSVGQEVTQSGETPRRCRVVAQITGCDGPEYRIKSGTSEAVVAERELTYRTEPPSGTRRASVVH
jgi:hypothetical protein